MNDWTGVNAGQVQQDAQVFLDRLAEINQAAVAAFEEFAESLHNNWASPVAKNISAKWAAKMDDFAKQANQCLENTKEKLTTAINGVLSANNAGSIILNILFPIRISLPIGGFLEEKDAAGRVGMIVKNVRNDILPKLKSKIEEIIAKYDELPKTLSLYDEAGAQQEAFNTDVEQVKLRLMKDLEEIENDINEKSSTEINNMLLAVNKSTNTFSA